MIKDNRFAVYVKPQYLWAIEELEKLSVKLMSNRNNEVMKAIIEYLAKFEIHNPEERANKNKEAQNETP